MKEAKYTEVADGRPIDSRETRKMTMDTVQEPSISDSDDATVSQSYLLAQRGTWKFIIMFAIL